MENNKIYRNLSINAFQRAVEKKGHDGTQYTCPIDAVTNFNNFKSSLLAAVFSPFLGISLVIHEIWHHLTSKGKVDDFIDLSNAIIFSGTEKCFISGQFEVKESIDKKQVLIHDNVANKSFTYVGSKQQLIHTLQYAVYIAADENTHDCPPIQIVELNKKIEDAKMEMAKNCNRKIFPTEFEYYEENCESFQHKISKPILHQISSIAILQQQFDTRCKLAGENQKSKDEFKEIPANITAILSNNKALVDDYNEYGRGGRMVVYVTPDRIEEVWRKSQLYVKDATRFTDIKIYFADPESKYRPVEHINNYSVIFYIGDFFEENAAKEARQFLVEEGIVDTNDCTKFIDDEQPDFASWTFPDLPTRKSKEEKVNAALREIEEKKQNIT